MAVKHARENRTPKQTEMDKVTEIDEREEQNDRKKKKVTMVQEYLLFKITVVIIQYS